MANIPEEKWDAHVEGFLDARPDELFHPRSYYRDLWAAHREAGFASSHFVKELTKGEETTFRERVWEMALGRHLRMCGYQVTGGKKGEPDFQFEVDGKRVWVEATCPRLGQDMPPHWTTWDWASSNSAGLVPFREMLLRYTQAIAEKYKKGVGYRANGTVRPEDAYVIGIDQSQINRFPDLNGISRVPFVVEAVFPIGPLAIEVDVLSGKLGSGFQTIEPEVLNRNKSPVSKTIFHSPDYSGVTAVFACHPFGSAPDLLPMKLVHNPLADVPIAPGRFGNLTDEWQATLVGQDEGGDQSWEVERVFIH